MDRFQQRQRLQRRNTQDEPETSLAPRLPYALDVAVAIVDEHETDTIFYPETRGKGMFPILRKQPDELVETSSTVRSHRLVHSYLYRTITLVDIPCILDSK